MPKRTSFACLFLFLSALAVSALDLGLCPYLQAGSGQATGSFLSDKGDLYSELGASSVTTLGSSAPYYAIPLGSVGVELSLAGADEKRQSVEGVDRPIGNNGPGDERDQMLPVEHHRGDVIVLGGEPVRPAIGQVEERREEQEPSEPAPPGPRFGRDALGRTDAQVLTRSASDTVKMPHSSMRCSILRKPAASTS